MFRISFLYAAVVLIAAPLAHAETWYVAADGTGDFSVIQDAVDATSDGDVIQIAPGRYDYYQTLPYGPDRRSYDIYVLIDGKQLSLVGAGADATIIGPEDPDHHPWPARGVYLMYVYNCGGLQIRDIGFEHSPDIHVLCYADRLEMEDCDVRGGRDGVRLRCPDGGYIRNTSFTDLNGNLGDAVVITAPTVEFEVTDCQFENFHTNVFIQGAPVRCDVRNCVFDGRVNGCGFSNGASGTIVDCEFRNLLGCAVLFGWCGPVSVTDNVIDLDSGCGVKLWSSHGVTLRDNIIATRTGTCVFVAGSDEGLLVRDNHLLRCGIDGGPDLGGYFAKTTDYWPYTTVYVDLSGNYWGTLDLDEISEFIIDGYDMENVNMYIEYEPILDGPVPVQTKSWSSVKALYR